MTPSDFETWLEVKVCQNSTISLRVQYIHNLSCNILELYTILVYMRFATDKAKLDIQYNKFGMQVASRIVKRIKTEDLRKLGKILKTSNQVGYIVQCPATFPEIRFWQKQLRKHAKLDNKLFLSCLIYWISQFCSKQFVWDCRLPLNVIYSIENFHPEKAA